MNIFFKYNMFFIYVEGLDGNNNVNEKKIFD